MTIKSSGAISFSDMNIELGKSSIAIASFNDSNIRTLLGKSTGQISLSDAYNKSNIANGGTITCGQGALDAGNGEMFYYTGYTDPNNSTFGGQFGSCNPSSMPVAALGGAILDGLFTGVEGYGNFLYFSVRGSFGNPYMYITIDGVKYQLAFNGTGSITAWIANTSFEFIPETTYNVSFSTS